MQANHIYPFNGPAILASPNPRCIPSTDTFSCLLFLFIFELCKLYCLHLHKSKNKRRHINNFGSSGCHEDARLFSRHPLLSRVQKIQVWGFFFLPNFFFIQLPCCPAQFKSFLPSLTAENACCQKLIYLFWVFWKGKQNSRNSTESVFLINVAAPPPSPPPV